VGPENPPVGRFQDLNRAAPAVGSSEFVFLAAKLRRIKTHCRRIARSRIPAPRSPKSSAKTDSPTKNGTNPLGAVCRCINLLSVRMNIGVDGDFVITAPDQSAVEGHPYDARQREQIGVNCGIHHHDGRRITLIPVNESSTAQTFDESDLLWAHRVLFWVRLSLRR
jgi:hypothetical protein